MKKLTFLTLTIMVMASVILAGPSLSATEASVTATVVPELVSVKLSNDSPSAVSYGTLNLGDTGAVPVSPSYDPTLTFINNGTVEEDFYARGNDATATGSTWTLSGSPGADTYVHKIAIPTNVFVLTKTEPYPLLASVIAPNGAGSIDTNLRLSMPTSISGDYVQHSTTVIVIAVKHT